jgi:hypothetical protein
MKNEIVKSQESSEPTEPTPAITPEMIERTFEALETRGMIYYSEGGVYIPTAKGWQLLMKIGMISEDIIAHGNPKITATNKSMIKITKGNDVDDATIGVRANKSCANFSEEFKRAIESSKACEIKIEVDDELIAFIAYGSPALKLTDTNYITINKTDFVDAGTAAIVSDKAASDLDGEFVGKLKNPNSKIKIILEVK